MRLTVQLESYTFGPQHFLLLKYCKVINSKDKLDLFIFCRKTRHTACLLHLFYIIPTQTNSTIAELHKNIEDVKDLLATPW